MRLKDRIAVVTGAGQGDRAGLRGGTGEGLGADVVVADIDHATAQDAPRRSRGLEDAPWSTDTDVSSSGQIRAMVETTVSKFGRLDILVNTRESPSPSPRRRSPTRTGCASSTST